MHVATDLDEKLDAHDHWLDGEPGGAHLSRYVRPLLRRVDLTGADLRRADLRAADLSGTKLPDGFTISQED